MRLSYHNKVDGYIHHRDPIEESRRRCAKIKLGISATCVHTWVCTRGGAWDGGGIRLEWTRQIDNTRFRSARNNTKSDQNLAIVWRKVSACPPRVSRDPGRSPGGYNALGGSRMRSADFRYPCKLMRIGPGDLRTCRRTYLRYICHSQCLVSRANPSNQI